VVGKLHIKRPSTNKSGLKPESRFTAPELHSIPEILAKAFNVGKHPVAARVTLHLVTGKTSGSSRLVMQSIA